MWVCPTQCDVTLDVVTYEIFLYHCIGILCYENAFIIVFVYFVFEDQRRGFFCYLNSRLLIEANEIIFNHFGFVILPFYKYPILLIPCDRHIFFYFRRAYHSFIAPRSYPIFFVFVYFVQIYHWETTINLYSASIFANRISAYFHFAS